MAPARRPWTTSSRREQASFNSCDGVSFFASTHVSGASGQQSHLLSYMGKDMDEPTSEHFNGAIEGASATMAGHHGDVSDPYLFAETERRLEIGVVHLRYSKPLL